MRKARMNSPKKIEKIVQWTLYLLLIVTIIMALFALFTKRTPRDAAIGSFESTEFTQNWTLNNGQTIQKISLPYSSSTHTRELTIQNTLPDNVTNGMSLITFSSMSDIYIRIDGRLRESYASKNIKHMSYFIPSAYNVVELNQKDAGKEISITINPKAQIHIGEVYIGYGNNVWFRIIQQDLGKIAIAFVVLILGIILSIISKIMQRISKNASAGFVLGLFMMDFAIWIFSESGLRQLIFNRPSMSQYFSYLAMELCTPLACLYFDAVQRHKHHKVYFFITMMSTIQILVNIGLHFTGAADFYETLLISHIWLGLGIFLTGVNIIRDIKSGLIRQYLASAIGMILLLAMGISELFLFYSVRFYSIGTVSSLGLIFLAAATIVQNLIDQMRTAREREEKHRQMIIKTVESIAMAIDAKDEYTGGHSERVGYYAAVLANHMARDWGFTYDDVQRIHYIGLMHDIGKIGVADSVLNKQGRLNDSEFNLMKKHTIIGSEILAGIDMDLPGLTDGIRYHHERYDGKGYPDGLAGEAIPLIARILCLADSYDAMTSNRIYRRRLSDQAVRTEFVRCSGSQFDPKITEVFIRLLDSGEISPVTRQGMTTRGDGSVLKSALLEKHLIDLTESGQVIDHPEYIRMIAFLTKLDENRGRHVDLFLLTFQCEPEKAVIETIQSWLSPQELAIICDSKLLLLALSGRSEEFISGFEDFLREIDGIKVERI